MRALTDDELENMRIKLATAFEQASEGCDSHSPSITDRDSDADRAMRSIQTLTRAAGALLAVNRQIEERLADKSSPLDKSCLRNNLPGT